MSTGVEAIFAIPSGAEWKSTREPKGGELVISLERTLAAGASLAGDLSAKDDSGNMRFVNQVTVTRLGPRRFRYRETLQWKGDRTKGSVEIKAEDLARIMAILPKALATAENGRALTRSIQDLMIPMTFGPGDPLLATGFLHPDLAEQRATQRIGPLLAQSLEKQFGDKLPPPERYEAARKIIREILPCMKVPNPDDVAANPSANQGSGMAALMFIVKTPGHIVSSNGEVNKFTGEVFWAMFEEAALLKDVVMTAVIDFN